jgi:anti-sigma regulatory factor (Ser/Thr protein kinase)
VSSYHPLQPRRVRRARPARSAAPQLHERAGWVWEQAFPGTLEQVRRVRDAVRLLLRECSAVDDLVLVFSELSANAVAHSRSSAPGGKFTVRLRHLPCYCVQGEVEDEGSAWDGNLGVSARDTSGLFLVLKLASGCGVAPGTTGGCVVWFRRECSAGGGNLPVPLGAPGLVTAVPEAAGRLLAAPPWAGTAGSIAKEQPDDW